MDIERLISDRARSLDASGIRRVFERAAALKDPINLSIGQPDFEVPRPIKDAAKRAIDENHNGYTLSQGMPALREAVALELERDLGWPRPESSPDAPGLMVTTGTSGALVLAFLAMLGPGDEAIIPDPYFVMYPHLATIAGGRAVKCDTYPDFAMTAELVEPLITDRTKFVLFNSPGNPTGTVATSAQCRDLLALCREKGVLLVSDEIYDEFCFSESRTEVPAGGGQPRCPSPCRVPGSEQDVLLIRGFGKSYGVTGWRLGYASGPPALIREMIKIQQYTFVCAPSMGQWGAMAALETDITAHVDAYQKRRDTVVSRLSEVTDLATPGGAFYAFPRVPEKLGLTGSQFVERALDRNLLVIPGGVFSGRDTHLRISFASPPEKIEQGLDILCDLFTGG